MKKLCIEIDTGGALRLSVDDEPVGLIQDLKLIAGSDTPPTVDVIFSSLSSLPADSSGLRDELLESLDRYHKLLEGFPFVKIFEKADTLPEGMPAVSPGD